MSVTTLKTVTEWIAMIPWVKAFWGTGEKTTKVSVYDKSKVCVCVNEDMYVFENGFAV